MKSKTEDQIIRSIRSYYPDVYEETLIETMGNDDEFKPAAALPKEVEIEPARADDAIALSCLREMRRVIK